MKDGQSKIDYKKRTIQLTGTGQYYAEFLASSERYSNTNLMAN
ncbi:MAG: hypothetical protein WB612_09095 [Nitrososphaeraceae archaeon]